MKIPYLTRDGKFKPQCIVQIKKQGLKNNRLQIVLDTKEKGYSGNISVTISNADFQFETDFESADPTRFPVRIKAASSALKELGLYGIYFISHENGILEINRQV